MVRENPITLLGQPPISMESDASGGSDGAIGETDEMYHVSIVIR
jgi:hypothetical protein